MPRNDTLLVLTNDGALARWQLDAQTNAHKVATLEVGPARSLTASSQSDAGLVVTPDGELVVFDFENDTRARFPAPPSTRCAWLRRRV